MTYNNQFFGLQDKKVRGKKNLMTYYGVLNAALDLQFQQKTTKIWL